MNDFDSISLGLGIESPWQIVSQMLDRDTKPNALRIKIKAKRGTKFPCPVCGKLCKAHDFQELTWRHLNFFQHHCYISAWVPRTDCPEHGVKRIEVPWARKGSHFTLLFEQAAMVLVREMPVLSAARIIGITDQALWRIVYHYVSKAVAGLDLSNVEGIGVDETASKRGHHYVTVFIDLDKLEKPVIFAVEGKGKETIEEFKKFGSSTFHMDFSNLKQYCLMFPDPGTGGQALNLALLYAWLEGPVKIAQGLTRREIRGPEPFLDPLFFTPPELYTYNLIQEPIRGPLFLDRGI